MKNVILVGLGGALGAISRYGVGCFFRAYVEHPFPYATLVVNVSGCLAIGVLYTAIRAHFPPPFLSLLVIIGIGFLGAYTTFSTYGFETIELMRNAKMSLALINIALNNILCLAAVVCGVFLGGLIKL